MRALALEVLALTLLAGSPARTYAAALASAGSSESSSPPMCRKVIVSPCAPAPAPASLTRAPARTSADATRARPARPPAQRKDVAAVITLPPFATAAPAAPAPAPEARAGVSPDVRSAHDAGPPPPPQLDFSRLHWTVTRRTYGAEAAAPLRPVPPPEVLARDFGVLVERRFGP